MSWDQRCLGFSWFPSISLHLLNTVGSSLRAVVCRGIKDKLKGVSLDSILPGDTPFFPLQYFKRDLYHASGGTLSGSRYPALDDMAIRGTALPQREAVFFSGSR